MDVDVRRGPDARALPRWAPPVAVAGASAAGLAYVASRNPAGGGAFLPCPFHALTGLWCPGCGMTRGLHQLLHLDVAAALGYNALLPLFLAIVLAGWTSWLLRGLGHDVPSIARVPNRWWYALAGVALLFGVARNLPLAPLQALAP